MSYFRIALCAGLFIGFSTLGFADTPETDEAVKTSEETQEKKEASPPPAPTDVKELRWLRYISILEAKIAQDQGDYNLYLRLADAYGRLGKERRDKVIYYTTKATLNGADNARVDIVLGDYYKSVKDYTASIRAYLRVLDQAPSHGYTLVQLRALVLEADPKTADLDLGLIKNILKEAGLYLPGNPPKEPDPESAKPLVEEGYGYLGSEEYEKAHNRFQAALDLDPNSGVAIRGMGIAYAQTKQIRQALAAYTVYLTLSPDAADAQAVREVIEIFYETRGN